MNRRSFGTIRADEDIRLLPKLPKLSKFENKNNNDNSNNNGKLY